MPYRVSAGYTNQNGILKTSKFERYTGSVNLAPSFFEDHLNINFNAKGMISNNRFADTGSYRSGNRIRPDSTSHERQQ